MPGSQCCNYMRREFQLRRFGCSEVHPARFTYFQWRVPLCVVLVYRLLTAAYCTTWLIYISRFGPINSQGVDIPPFAFLTMWTYLVLTVYLLLHFLSCLLYIWSRGGNICERMSRENHRHIFHELQVEPSLWASAEYEEIAGRNSDDDFNVETHTAALPWLMKLVWFFYNIASNACIMVTLVFWIMLYPYLDLSGDFDLMINIQLHGVTSVIVIIEICLSAVPIRLPHYIYTLIYGLVYVTFSGIYYAVDHRNILYPGVLDWSKPKPTAIVCVITAFVVLPLIQLFLFGVYKLRLYIYDKCNPESI